MNEYGNETVEQADHVREKMMEMGPFALSDHELAYLALGSKSSEKSPTWELLGALEGCNGNAPLPKRLTKLEGIGPAAACRFAAVFELARRYLVGGEGIRGPEDVAAMVRDIVDLKQEHFLTLTLDGGGCLIRKRTVFIGTLNQTVVHPREVFALAIEDRASGVVLVHNHPSGRIEPSREDVSITERLARVGKLVGIEVIDHVIVGKEGAYSFKAEGLLEAERSGLGLAAT